MNEEQSGGPVVEAHLSPDICHVNGSHGKCLGADMPLQRGPSDVFVNAAGKTATITSPSKSAGFSDSSSEEIKGKGENTGFSERQDAPVKIEKNTIADPLALTQSTQKHGFDQEHQPTKLQALDGLLQQFAVSEKSRAEQENTARRLEERIRSAEIAHGRQLKELAALQRAIEVRRKDIGIDKKAYTETRLAQQQATQASEELRATLGRITVEIHAGVQGSSSTSST